MELTNIGVIKELLARHNFRFSKSLGQNFLTNPQIPEQIAALAGDNQTSVLEIGPGMGTLTVKLAQAAKQVLCVEVDETLKPVLAETLATYKNVSVVYRDFLKADIPELLATLPEGRVNACANLPYYITSPVLAKLIESRAFGRITVMVQKEVADRICAAPGTADYSAFTVFVNYHCAPQKALFVPRGCFVPSPKVDSAVVVLDIRPRPPAVIEDEQLFFKVVKAGFAQRRKILLNGLFQAFGTKYDKPALTKLLEQCGIPPTVRGETLGIPEFASIANEMCWLNA